MLSNSKGDYLVGLTSGRECLNDTDTSAGTGGNSAIGRRLRTDGGEDDGEEDQEDAPADDGPQEKGAWGYYIDLSNKCLLKQIVTWLVSRWEHARAAC